MAVAKKKPKCHHRVFIWIKFNAHRACAIYVLQNVLFGRKRLETEFLGVSVSRIKSLAEENMFRFEDTVFRLSCGGIFAKISDGKCLVGAKKRLPLVTAEREFMGVTGNKIAGDKKVDQVVCSMQRLC